MMRTVYATKASALSLKHPHGPAMAVGGVQWPNDSFTGRRLADGSITDVKAKAYAPPVKMTAPESAAVAAVDVKPDGKAAQG